MTLLTKLNDFRKKVDVVKKDCNNAFYKSKYATLESVIGTIEPVLNELNINYIQLIENNTLKTIIYDVDNEKDCIESITPLIIAEENMQKLGSAVTYARRYSLVTMFGLEQEDDDGNATLEEKVINTFKGAKVVNNNIPTQEEVTNYIAENNYMNVTGISLYKWFEKNNWLDKQGKPIDWKHTIDYFEKNKK